MSRAKALTLELEQHGPFDPADMTVAEAKRRLRAFYVGQMGYASLPRLLTLPEAQHKLGMSARRAVGLSLAPADMSGDYDVCMWRTAACTSACVLVTAGKGTLPSVRRARVAKTKALAQEPQAFVTLLAHELAEQVRRYGPIDFRPNVASDLRWELIAPRLFDLPDVRVYDYTKAPAAQRSLGPTAYDRLVFSVSENPRSGDEALEWLRSGANVAVVFATVKGHPLPATFAGFPVVDADTSDSRVDDPAGVVVGLRAKGSARGVAGAWDGFVKPDQAS